MQALLRTLALRCFASTSSSFTSAGSTTSTTQKIVTGRAGHRLIHSRACPWIHTHRTGSPRLAILRSSRLYVSFLSLLFPVPSLALSLTATLALCFVLLSAMSSNIPITSKMERGYGTGVLKDVHAAKRL